jgi:hypothetical protein
LSDAFVQSRWVEREVNAAFDVRLSREPLFIKETLSDPKFDAPDPYQAGGGPKEPTGWNRFSYVGGDPVNHRNHPGLFIDDDACEGDGECGIDDGGGDDPGQYPVCGKGQTYDPKTDSCVTPTPTCEEQLRHRLQVTLAPDNLRWQVLRDNLFPWRVADKSSTGDSGSLTASGGASAIARFCTFRMGHDLTFSWKNSISILVERISNITDRTGGSSAG